MDGQRPVRACEGPASPMNIPPSGLSPLTTHVPGVGSVIMGWGLSFKRYRRQGQLLHTPPPSPHRSCLFLVLSFCRFAGPHMIPERGPFEDQDDPGMHQEGPHYRPS